MTFIFCSFFARGLRTRIVVARLRLRQLDFIVLKLYHTLIAFV